MYVVITAWEAPNLVMFTTLLTAANSITHTKHSHVRLKSTYQLIHSYRSQGNMYVRWLAILAGKADMGNSFD